MTITWINEQWISIKISVLADLLNWVFLLPCYFFIGECQITEDYGEAYSTFDGISFDHKIVSAKKYLSLCRNKKLSGKVLQYDWSSLDNSDISN